MLRRFGIGAVLALIVVALTASVAVAHHNPNHQRGGGSPPQQGSGNPLFVVGPTFNLGGDNTVTATGSIAGLGNTNIDLELIVTGSQTVQCENPSGQIAPGQTQQLSSRSVREALRPEQGRVNFEISSTLVGATPEQLAGACPAANWTPLPGAVEVTGATLNVYQPAGSNNVILTRIASF